MQPSTAFSLPQLILDLRADLRQRFHFHEPKKRNEYLSWLVSTGTQEYPPLLADATLRSWLDRPSNVEGLTGLQEMVWRARTDVQRVFKLPQDAHAFVAWFFRHGVGEHGLWPWLTPCERQTACLTEGPWQAAHLQRATDSLVHEPLQPQGRLPWGVNLIGYVDGQLGIGEDVRMAARALLAVDVPMCMINFKPGRDIPQNDHSMSAYVVDGVGPYAVNIFCLTALEHGRFFAERGTTQLRGRYNIGYWPWELSRWPAQWAQLTHLVDEVWVSTKHTYDAVAPMCAALPKPVPVQVMPMAVELGSVTRGTRKALREYWGLPQLARLMVFTFDLNSSIHRKNPQAVVDSFLRAFPASEWGHEQVGLVIKVHPPKRRHAAWNRLKQLAAQDSRLHIIEQTLPRPELLALFGACDAYVSLHRAEGFGRGIAEALQLGLHVITTQYSGNVDFCSAPAFADMVDFVRYRLVKVRPSQYPYGAGQSWANVDLTHAAESMRSFVQRFPPGRRRLPPHPVPLGGWPIFSPAHVGERYAERLTHVRRATYDAPGHVAWPAVAPID